ncbi:uncharacterized protein N7483_007630 [Penicillium malachiteum]|uniref:uncharacterized protein n=1 Tax=Penicillium malachiteum TaxID=1324776 RepID=UPI00254854AD|nr:uncharacterized protein N7483_007630 [Penicillium malachiteum]KAJ5726273.1 hypothetical protein N7483_007630 [Penicillium malachiteum]
MSTEGSDLKGKEHQEFMLENLASIDLIRQRLNLDGLGVEKLPGDAEVDEDDGIAAAMANADFKEKPKTIVTRMDVNGVPNIGSVFQSRGLKIYKSPEAAPRQRPYKDEYPDKMPRNRHRYRRLGYAYAVHEGPLGQ